MRKKEIKPRNTKPKYDLTGQTFGYLTVDYWDKQKGWHCKCKCGNETFVSSRNLRTDHSTSCGCKRYETKNQIDMSGFETPYLKVIGQEEKIKGKYPKWICLCKNCGREIHLEGKYLRSYNLQSCGCIKSSGELKIIQLLENSNVQYSKEYTFPDLLGICGGRLRFDFAVFKNNKLYKLIEYNGKQHYEEPGGSWSSNFNTLLEHDKRKKEYCDRNGINLKIIKYSDNFSLQDLIL